MSQVLVLCLHRVIRHQFVCSQNSVTFEGYYTKLTKMGHIVEYG